MSELTLAQRIVGEMQELMEHHLRVQDLIERAPLEDRDAFDELIVGLLTHPDPILLLQYLDSKGKGRMKHERPKRSKVAVVVVVAALFFCSVALRSFWAATASGARLEPLSLAEQGHPRAVITVADGASPEVSETAHDLSDIIFKMSGARLPVVSKAGEQSSLALGVQDQDRSLPPLAYHVLRNGDVLYFSGGSDQGVVNGVYAFLEQQLGCRWYTPDALGEHIPRRATITVGDVTMQDSPDFKSFAGFGRHPDAEASRLWMRRNRLEGFPRQFHSHNWFKIIPPESIDEHPEWFALLGDARSTRQLCTTHPGVLKMTVDKARRYFDAHPEAQSFSLSPNDHRGFCRCDTCHTLDAKLGIDPFVPGGSLSDRLVYFFNQVATQVVKTHPERRLAFYAYLTYTKPPKVVKPHPMLQPFLVHTPWDYCMNHPIDDPDCERNRSFVESTLGWRKLSSDLGMYDYYGHWSLGGPIGMVHRIRRDLPWLLRHGGAAFYAEAHSQWWTQGLNLYLPPKLAWDIDADVDAIVAEYYNNMFGPAAAAVFAYGQMFEDVLAHVPKDAERDYQQAFLTAMTPEYLARAAALLDQAQNRFENANLGREAAKIAARLRRYRYGLRIIEQQALEKQARQAGRMAKVVGHLNALMSILDEVAADPELEGMMELHFVRLFARHELIRLPPYDRIWQQAVQSPQRRADLRRRLDENHTRDVARALGYWNDWYIVGLWTNPDGDPMGMHYPPEDKVDLDAKYQMRGGEAGWQLHRSESAYGIVDLRAHFQPQDSEYTMAYAYTRVNTRRDAEVFLDVMCDDDIVVWVNDRLVFAGGAGNHSFNLHLGVRLDRGENRILAKILNRPHAFNFSVRIVTEDGRPHDAVVWE